jgi:hypothetical protein
MAALLVQGLGVFHFSFENIREGGRVETRRISVVVVVATIAPVWGSSALVRIETSWS